MGNDIMDHLLLGVMPSSLTIGLLLFLISLTIRAGKTQRESQLFTLVCMIHLAHHLVIILSDILLTPVQALYAFRTVHLGFIFLLPVSVHYVHHALKLPHTKHVIMLLYGMTLCLLPFVLTARYFSVGGGGLDGGLPSGGPLFAFFLAISLAFLLGYVVLIAVTSLRRGEPSVKRKAVFILAGLFPTYLLTFGDALPLFGFHTDSVGGFVFIPMGLFTYGILRYQILGNKGWFSMGYIPNVLTTLVWLPLGLALLLFALTHETLFYPNVVGRLFPLALPAMISVIVCFVLASFCFQQGSRQAETLVFGGICALWGLMNLDLTLLFVLRDMPAALQINRFDHFFLVMQVGFCSHLFYYFAGFRKWMVYVAYGISLIFVPLTQTPFYLTGIHSYSWGLFASRGFLFDLLIGIAMVKLLLGCAVLVKKIKAADPGSETRRQYFFFLAGVLSMGAFGLSNLPAMSGLGLYPFGTFMFIPVLLMAYGVFRYEVVRINEYFKRRLWASMAVILIYTGYILLGMVMYMTVRTLPVAAVTARVAESGIPLILSLSTCVFFSVLSLRVGPSLVGSRLFGLICMIFAFLSADILLNSLVVQPEAGLRISRLNHVLLVMWPALYLHLVVLVCRKRESSSLVRFGYAAGVTFALFSQSPWYLTGMVRYPWGFFAQRGPLFDLFCLVGLIVFLYCLVLFYQTRRRVTHPLDRQRLTLFAVGLGASALFTAGNIPAMSGYDVYPPGNYVFVPIALFGYAMFRKNLRDVLVLLNQCVYAAGVLGFLILATVGICALKPLAWTPGSVLLFLGAGMVLFSGYKTIWSSVLALFFGRQKEMLNQWYVRLTDQLSKSRSLGDIVQYLSEPLFQAVSVWRFRVLFYSDEEQRFLVFESLNPRAAVGGLDRALWDHRATFTARHPLMALFQEKRGVITRAQVESWIVNANVTLDPDEMLRSADIIQPVFSETTLVSLILFYGKEDGSVYSGIENEFIERIGLSMGPYIENAKLLQGLEKEIDKRTADLTAAVRVKSDFLARMSHEVRSPLNAILGMGDLLNDTPLNDEQAQYMEILTNSSGLLLSVINDILDFSKLDAGRVELESIAFDLYRLMNDLKNIILASSIKKNLSVTLIIAPSVNRHVCGDPFKLAQVIMNLADNALRFTEQGGITLHVGASEGADPDGTLHFCVEDTGIGIPEEKTALIFESFSQAESSTTRRYGGTGLGLTISRKLIHLMGGTIDVVSEVGRGSRFSFTVVFPQAEPVFESGVSPVSPAMARLKSFYGEDNAGDAGNDVLGPGPLKILLAEDIASNVRVVRLYLKALPVVLDVAEDGLEAVRMFREGAYDLVLMDIHMPRMDGYDAVREIRAWETAKGLRTVPVVALSAHVPDDLRSDDLGIFDGFLVKPFGRQELIRTLIRVLPQSAPEKPGKTRPLVLDPDLLPILPELIKEINEELCAMVVSLDRGDFSTVTRLSHGFKGAAGNFGLTELSDRFKDLHDQAVQGDPDRCAAMMDAIRDYVNTIEYR